MKFEIDGKFYQTDSETLKLLRNYVKQYRKGNKVARETIAAIMTLGLMGGRIKELSA